MSGHPFVVNDGRLKLKPDVSEEALQISSVRLSDLQIRRAKALGRLKQLKILNISFNQLETLQALAVLSELVSVDCSHNRIATLEGLSGSAANLTILRASDNKISGLHRLSDCTKLEELWLNRNSLGQLQELSHLRNITSLKRLILHPNPFCKSKNAKYRIAVLSVLPQLQSLDAVTFNDNERELAVIRVQEQKEKELKEKQKKMVPRLSRRGSNPYPSTSRQNRNDRKQTHSHPRLARRHSACEIEGNSSSQDKTDKQLLPRIRSADAKAAAALKRRGSRPRSGSGSESKGKEREQTEASLREGIAGALAGLTADPIFQRKAPVPKARRGKKKQNTVNSHSQEVYRRKMGKMNNQPIPTHARPSSGSSSSQRNRPSSSISTSILSSATPSSSSSSSSSRHPSQMPRSKASPAPTHSKHTTSSQQFQRVGSAKSKKAADRQRSSRDRSAGKGSGNGRAAKQSKQQSVQSVQSTGPTTMAEANLVLSQALARAGEVLLNANKLNNDALTTCVELSSSEDDDENHSNRHSDDSDHPEQTTTTPIPRDQPPGTGTDHQKDHENHADEDSFSEEPDSPSPVSPVSRRIVSIRNNLNNQTTPPTHLPHKSSPASNVLATTSPVQVSPGLLTDDSFSAEPTESDSSDDDDTIYPWQRGRVKKSKNKLNPSSGTSIPQPYQHPQGSQAGSHGSQSEVIHPQTDDNQSALAISIELEEGIDDEAVGASLNTQLRPGGVDFSESVTEEYNIQIPEVSSPRTEEDFDESQQMDLDLELEEDQERERSDDVYSPLPSSGKLCLRYLREQGVVSVLWASGSLAVSLEHTAETGAYVMYAWYPGLAGSQEPGGMLCDVMSRGKNKRATVNYLSGGICLSFDKHRGGFLLDKRGRTLLSWGTGGKVTDYKPPYSNNTRSFQIQLDEHYVLVFNLVEETCELYVSLDEECVCVQPENSECLAYTTSPPGEDDLAKYKVRMQSDQKKRLVKGKQKNRPMDIPKSTEGQQKLISSLRSLNENILDLDKLNSAFSRLKHAT